MERLLTWVSFLLGLWLFGTLNFNVFRRRFDATRIARLLLTRSSLFYFDFTLALASETWSSLRNGACPIKFKPINVFQLLDHAIDLTDALFNLVRLLLEHHVCFELAVIGSLVWWFEKHKLVDAVLVVLVHQHKLVHHFLKELGRCGAEVLPHPVERDHRQCQTLSLLNALHAVLPPVKQFLPILNERVSWLRLGQVTQLGMVKNRVLKPEILEGLHLPFFRWFDRPFWINYSKDHVLVIR